MPDNSDLAEVIKNALLAANTTVKEKAIDRVAEDQEGYVNPFADSPGLDILDDQLEESSGLLEAALSDEEAVLAAMKIDEAAENKNDSKEWLMFSVELLRVARKVFLTA